MYARLSGMAPRLERQEANGRLEPGRVPRQRHPHEAVATAVVAPAGEGPRKHVHAALEQALLRGGRVQLQRRDVQPGDTDVDPRLSRPDGGVVQGLLQLLAVLVDEGAHRGEPVTLG